MTSARSTTARPARRTTAARSPSRRTAPARRASARRRPPGRRPQAGRRRRRSARATSWRAWLPLGLLAVVILGVVALVRSTGGPEPVVLGGSCTVPGTALTLTSEQASSAATIAAVGRARGLSERAVVIALATAQQESTLRNLDYGDRDSLGLFQQRPSQGWGRPEQVQDPVYAAGKFYDGLVRVPNWEVRRLTDAAQQVQHSGFPEAYERWAGMAEVLNRSLAVPPPGSLTCQYEAQQRGGRLSQRTASAASAVEAELGVPATEGYGRVTVDPAVGWPGALWAVAHGERLGLDAVDHAGWRWTSGSGWEQKGTPDTPLTLSISA